MKWIKVGYMWRCGGYIIAETSTGFILYLGLACLGAYPTLQAAKDRAAT